MVDISDLINSVMTSTPIVEPVDPFHIIEFPPKKVCPKNMDSVLKNLHQIGLMAKHPFRAGLKVYEPPKEGIVISDGFFQKYGCYLNCGACCKAYSMDFTSVEWPQFVDLYPEHEGKAVQRHIIVNGVEKIVYTFDNKKPTLAFEKEWCSFLDKNTGGCGIHKYNALSCQVELIKFVDSRNRVYLTKGQYGRAFAMKKVVDNEPGLLCDFAPFDEDQFYNNDIPILRRMKGWADFFGIDTYLPYVIDLLINLVENKQQGTVELTPEKLSRIAA